MIEMTSQALNHPIDWIRRRSPFIKEADCTHFDVVWRFRLWKFARGTLVDNKFFSVNDVKLQNWFHICSNVILERSRYQLGVFLWRRCPATAVSLWKVHLAWRHSASHKFLRSRFVWLVGKSSLIIKKVSESHRNVTDNAECQNGWSPNLFYLNEWPWASEGA